MKMPTPEFIANTNKAVPIQTSTSADLTTAPSVPMGPPPPYPSASERYPGACAALNPLTSHEQNVGVGLGWLKSLGHRVKAFLYGKKGSSSTSCMCSDGPRSANNSPPRLYLELHIVRWSGFVCQETEL